MGELRITANDPRISPLGGRGGIRTHGTLAGTPVFKTGALNHSATLPAQEFQSLSVGLARTQCERSPDVHVIASFWKKPSDEGRSAPGSIRDVDTMSASPCAAWISAGDGRGEIRRARSTGRKAFEPRVGRMLIPDETASPGVKGRDRSGRLSSRTPRPAGSSTEARGWPWSGQEIRWRQCRGCA